jgi:cell division protein FtsB
VTNAKSWPRKVPIRNVGSTVKVLADTHVAPPLRRWLVRLGLAIVVAIAIGYVPGQLLDRDPRAAKLEAQLEQERATARELAAGNAALIREIEALRSNVGAIEDRARADLGMVYPDEIVFRVRRTDGPAELTP